MNYRRPFLIYCLLLALCGCSTVRPWNNQPIQPTSPTPGTLYKTAARAPISEQPSIAVAVTISGGGARAAAFGLGVLRELKETSFKWEGKTTTLLDSVVMASGVSGGSALAAYFAAYGDSVFTDFEKEFLLVDFQSSLIGRAFSPTTMYRLTSPWYGRGNVLAEELDNHIFHGMTFGELRARRSLPNLLITATDLTTGAPFEFTPEQFALICSDLNSVPLSFAVAASSAVPIVLSPLSLKNYGGECDQSSQVSESLSGKNNASARMIQAQAESYLDASQRPYLHLVDGGLADNLGIRGLIERYMAAGSLNANMESVAENSIRKLVLISINSERDVAERIDSSDRVPSTYQVLDSLIFGAGARSTQQTLAIFNENAQHWIQEIANSRGSKGSPFASDAKIYTISVNLRDLEEKSLLQIPTAFSIPPTTVSSLQEAGRQALRRSKEYKSLQTDLLELN